MNSNFGSAKLLDTPVTYKVAEYVEEITHHEPAPASAQFGQYITDSPNFGIPMCTCIGGMMYHMDSDERCASNIWINEYSKIHAIEN